MKHIDWDIFNSDEEVFAYLKKLPRYRNTPLKSAFWRAVFLLKVIWSRATGNDKPVFVVLVTNNRCNLNCRYCYGSYGERSKIEDYSTKELVQIIDRLKALGTGLLTLHGGESLLRKDIGEICNYAKLKGCYASLNTNGYLVPKKIEEIKCLDNICLSLDGREENNDKNRGMGCYKKVMEAMDIIRKYRRPCVISATLTKDTVDDMEYLADLALKNNCRLQYSILYNVDKMEGKYPEMVMTDQETRNVTQEIVELKKKGYPIYYSENVLTAAVNWPARYDERMFFTEKDTHFTKDNGFIPCYHGKLKYQIDADGRVITCWAQDDPAAPNVKELGVEGAIKKCHDTNKCRYCAFLANNEHNALLGLSFRTIIDLVCIHIADAFKIKDGRKL